MKNYFCRYHHFLTSTAIAVALVTIAPTISHSQDGVLPSPNAAFEPEFTPKKVTVKPAPAVVESVESEDPSAPAAQDVEAELSQETIEPEQSELEQSELEQSKLEQSLPATDTNVETSAEASVPNAPTATEVKPATRQEESQQAVDETLEPVAEQPAAKKTVENTAIEKPAVEQSAEIPPVKKPKGYLPSRDAAFEPVFIPKTVTLPMPEKAALEEVSEERAAPQKPMPSIPKPVIPEPVEETAIPASARDDIDPVTGVEKSKLPESTNKPVTGKSTISKPKLETVTPAETSTKPINLKPSNSKAATDTIVKPVPESTAIPVVQKPNPVVVQPDEQALLEAKPLKSTPVKDQQPVQQAKPQPLLQEKAPVVEAPSPQKTVKEPAATISTNEQASPTPNTMPQSLENKASEKPVVEKPVIKKTVSQPVNQQPPAKAVASPDATQPASSRPVTQPALKQVQQPVQQTQPKRLPSKAVAVFAGGCFWCMEPPYDATPGVLKTTSGYTGGAAKTADYQTVSKGGTGHYEAIQVTYDPRRVDYHTLLEIYWANVDALDNKGQFCDQGDSYRPGIFPATTEQQKLAEQSKQLVAKKYNMPNVAVTIQPLKVFYDAEDYHQDYYQKHPIRYKYYRWNCGRDQRLQTLWNGARQLELFEDE